MSILSAKYMHDEAAAFEHVESMLWPNGPVCPHCGVLDNAYSLKGVRSKPSMKNPEGRERHGLKKCKDCGRQFTVRMGTIFERGYTLKTAWRMGHEIRRYMNDVDDEWPLDGDVEADETYVGGKRSGKPGRGTIGKTIIFGMLQRGGDVMTKVVSNVKKRTLQPIIWENVKEGSTVHTDELRSYKGLDKAGYTHRTVNHRAGEYVHMGNYVNSLETFWSHLKLSIRGTHVHVSKQHLWMYMKEFEYRYNRREKPDSIFSDLVSGLGKLPLVTHQSDV